MNRKKEHLARYVLIGVLASVFAVVFVGRLININVTGQGYVADSSHTDTRTRVKTIHALRGEIFDRNGKPLVTNEYYYEVFFDAGSFSTQKNWEKNRMILNLLKAAKECGEDGKMTEILNPFSVFSTSENSAYSEEYMNSVYGKRLKKMLAEITEKEDEVEAQKAVELLLERYGLADSEGKLLYESGDCEVILKLRLDMEVHNFSTIEPYTIYSRVSPQFITRIKEDALRGVEVRSEAERVYNCPGYASHILGRTGKIQSKYAEYYDNLGYPMDAIVGISGAEQAFEEYLRGIDGEITVVEDKYGNVINEYVSKEPVAGKNVYLTIDIDIQKAAEDSLAKTVQMIVDKAKSDAGEIHNGEDADSGALVLQKAKTGDVIALASYPTYNLATFSEDYEELNNNPLSPMFNRALEGTYAPGSTFKPGVAAAALQEGIITTGTLIDCNGPYTYYADSDPTFHPACWIWNMYRGRHGPIAVTEAIQVSCNCFFYETGRLLTIQTMNKYCKGYGLGQPTGIELVENKGILAGPEYREENGLEAWTPGQTITAAIGQSDNLFTPLQIGTYISTLINKGTRYKAHMLYEVRDFSTGDIVYKPETEVADSSVTLSDSVTATVLNGMKNVMEEGSASSLFKNYAISVGGKTGTAQVSKEHSNNAVFTAFAPFDDPDVIATCVIERGATGTNAGYAVKDVFDKYFGFENPVPEDGNTEN